MAARTFALAIAVSALAGIVLEWGNLVAKGTGPIDAVWSLAGYFTILTNALVLLVFGLIAWRKTAAIHPIVLGGTVAAIALVGVIYTMLLTGLRPLGGSTWIANILLHYSNPILCAAYWLIFAKRGTLRWRDPLLWALYPLAYLPYAVARGFIEGRFAYPFIDVVQYGWTTITHNVVIITLTFVLAGELLVLFNRTLPRRSEPR